MRIKQIILALVLLLCSGSAWAQTGSVLTQTQLNTFIGATYPDQTVGQITPYGLRQGLLNLTATMFAGGGTAPVSGPSVSTVGCAAPWANTTGTLLANNCALSISGTTITATGLLDVVATAGGISISGNPDISVSFAGATPLAGVSNNLTANSATSPEINQFYSMTSATGSANATTAYKMNLAFNVACNSGSAYCWNLNPVMNIGAGGSKRGGIGIEADLNNNYGNYSGSPASPYAANYYATGTNGGGYSSCAFCAEFGGSGAMWQAALHGGPAGSGAYNTAFIWDESNSPDIIYATGSHTNGIDISGATLSLYAFKSPSFNVDSIGDVTGKQYAMNGGVFAAPSSSTYNLLYDGGGASGVLQLGNTSDPTNYYQNTSHVFRNRAQNAIFATINSSGVTIASGGNLLLAGSASGTGTLQAPAAASTYAWTLPAATGTLAEQSAVSKTCGSTIVVANGIVTSC